VTVNHRQPFERVHTAGTFQRVLVAYDGSEGAKKALDAAVGVARRDSADLVGLAIEAHLPHYGATVGEVEEERRFEEQACTQLLEEASRYAAGRGVAMHADIRAGHLAQEIVRAAHDQGADLIVIGHSGHSGVWGRFLGGTAEKVSRHAACSVLMVR
jgi:nucleotide-binding universal stress UspA family protein